MIGSEFRVGVGLTCLGLGTSMECDIYFDCPGISFGFHCQNLGNVIGWSNREISVGAKLTIWLCKKWPFLLCYSRTWHTGMEKDEETTWY